MILWLCGCHCLQVLALRHWWFLTGNDYVKSLPGIAVRRAYDIIVRFVNVFDSDGIVRIPPPILPALPLPCASPFPSLSPYLRLLLCSRCFLLNSVTDAACLESAVAFAWLHN